MAFAYFYSFTGAGSTEIQTQGDFPSRGDRISGFLSYLFIRVSWDRLQRSSKIRSDGRDAFLLQPLTPSSFFAERNDDDIVKRRQTKCCVILAQTRIN